MSWRSVYYWIGVTTFGLVRKVELLLLGCLYCFIHSFIHTAAAMHSRWLAIEDFISHVLVFVPRDPVFKSVYLLSF